MARRWDIPMGKSDVVIPEMVGGERGVKET